MKSVLAGTAAFIGCIPKVMTAAFHLLRESRKYDIIVFQHDGGFGHTIHTVDLARIVFSDKRVLYVFPSWPGRHNPIVCKLWANPTLRFLPFFIGYSKNRHLVAPSWFRSGLIKTLAAMSNLNAHLKVIPSYEKLFECAVEEATRRLGFNPAPLNTPRALGLLIVYLRLLSTVPVRPLKLSAELTVPLQHACQMAIDTEMSVKPTGLCCIYLRAKDDNVDNTSSARNGSPISDYVASFKRLVASGYQCLIVGDREIPKGIWQEFSGWVISADTIGAEKQIFDLFAATEADIFITEAGGGSWLAGINGIPTLGINIFPYYTSYLNATIHYKNVINRNKDTVDVELLLDEYAPLYDIPDCDIVPNSSEEIENAVVDFLENGIGHTPYGVPLDHIAPEARLNFGYHSNGHISPVWLSAQSEKSRAI